MRQQGKRGRQRHCDVAQAGTTGTRLAGLL